MIKELINSKEISVVVQGAISGSSKDSKDVQYTRICLDSIRNILPDSKIILSTWKNTDLKGLDYDLLIENEDPGSNIMDTYNSNCFRQIVSTLNGIKAVETKYVVKTRADIEFKGPDFIKYFEYFNSINFDKEYKVLNKRVVTMTTANPNRRYCLPFNISDWFFFGETEDVRNIFDFQLSEEIIIRDSRKIINPYYPEQYIWINFLRKNNVLKDFKAENINKTENIILSEKYFANNCIFLNAQQVKLIWLKNPGKAYSQIPCLSNSGLYSFNDYKKIINKYANNNLVIRPNYIEDILFFLNNLARTTVRRTIKLLQSLL